VGNLSKCTVTEPCPVYSQSSAAGLLQIKFLLSSRMLQFLFCTVLLFLGY
jgi:hypothetical protein